MKRYNRKLSKSKRKIPLLIVSIICTILFCIFILDKAGVVGVFTKKTDHNLSKEDKEAKTTSKAPSAQENYKEGGERQPGNTLNENRGSSIIKDTNGNIPNSVNQNQSISSATGEITVYTPSSGSLIKSGQVIAGSSALQRVTYRVLDDISGMISIGELRVINGRFSGEIDFDTSAKNGRIDIFATRSDGSEYSSVEIPIIFK